MKKWSKQSLLILASLAIACASLVWANNRSSSQLNVSADGNTLYGQTTEGFIASIGETARQIGQDNDLYASVMIAQAILESASGQSDLSQAPYYNYFGIKGSYYGNSVSMLTWEDDGQGNVEHIYADFRAYGSPADSLTDYAALLTTPLYAGARKSNTTSYLDATAALTGLYATDTAYADKLNSLIAYYGLTAYDIPLGYETGGVELSGQVWNPYRGQYTSSAILAEDEAWVAYTR